MPRDGSPGIYGTDRLLRSSSTERCKASDVKSLAFTPNNLIEQQGFKHLTFVPPGHRVNLKSHMVNIALSIYGK